MSEKKLPAREAAGPRSVGEARVAVETSRQRIASTLDELESRIVEKKESLEERLDVTRPVRDYVRVRPVAAVGMAVAAGLLFGLLTGGSRDRKVEPRHLTAEDRAAIERWRRAQRKTMLEAADAELGDVERSRPRRRKRSAFRDLLHELAGAGSALLIAELVERVRNADEG